MEDSNWFGEPAKGPRSTGLSPADEALSRASGADIHQVKETVGAYNAFVKEGNIEEANRYASIIDAYNNGASIADARRMFPSADQQMWINMGYDPFK